MSGEREYSFRGLNETRVHSNLSCCGENCFHISCGQESCTCKLLHCAFNCNYHQGQELEGSKRSLLKNPFFAMFNCAILAAIAYGFYWVSHVHADIEKYKVCVVDGRGGFQRSGKYCPILDEPDSKVECVIGLDRLDCLRRISKGKVDFGVFTAEDLVAAQNSLVEILLTNELRFSKDKFEYDVVAIVNDDAGINSKHDLQDKRFCHPGYGQESEWSRILANYFEASVVPKLCEESLSLMENRIKAASQYFRAACKAGPWVSDDLLDQKLKKKYSNLCSLCGAPGRCSKRDKYWGRRGPLYCLTDGAGDVTWARLDDAKAHFGITPGAQSASPEGFSYLCPDDSKRPVNTSNPCVWVSKPWPVILAKRTSAQEIQGFINHLNHSDTDSWQNALLNLIESYHVDITSVHPIQAIQSYLDQAPGFLSAYSFTGCHPPRSIRMCTTSNLENTKCGWMREAAAVYGIEPDFDCVKADNKTHCLLAIQTNLADAVLLSPDYILSAERDFKLIPLVYEDVSKEDRYETVAVIRKDSTIKEFSDLRYKKACFPQFEGIAWNTMLYEFHKRGLLSHECPYSVKAAHFWGETCAPDAPDSVPKSLTKLCSGEYVGDEGALKCLIMEKADVAFVSMSTVRKIAASSSNEEWVSSIKSQTKILCENKFKHCKLSWATIGQIMVSGSSSEMFQQESFDAFMQVDSLFGNNYDSLTRSFSLYGPFDGQHNILFDDATTSLQSKAYMNTIEEPVPSYDVILSEVSECLSGSSNSLKPYFAIFVASFYLVKFLL